MKKKNKGMVGFVIGIIVYALASILSIIVAFVAVDIGNHANSVERPILALIAFGAGIVFIALTLWFLSFSVGFNQRKAQIELLESMANQNSEV